MLSVVVVATVSKCRRALIRRNASNLCMSLSATGRSSIVPSARSRARAVPQSKGVEGVIHFCPSKKTMLHADVSVTIPSFMIKTSSQQPLCENRLFITLLSVYLSE